MTRTLTAIGSIIGGYAGWALGSLGGTFSAFVVSMVGTGIGVYAGRRFGRSLEG